MSKEVSINPKHDIIKQKAIFKGIFDHMSSGVAVYEPRKNGRDFIFKEFNNASEKIEHIKRKDVIGKSVLKVFPEVRKFGIFNVFKEVYKTGKSKHYSVKLYKDDRIRGWRENYIYKLPTGEIVAVYDDVTAEGRALEDMISRHKQLLSIFDSIDEVIYVADPKTYQLVYFNKAFTKRWKAKIGDKCYKVLQNLNSPCSFCSNKYIFNKNLGKTHIWEWQNLVNKCYYRCIDRAINWPDGRNVRYEMAVDITDIKNAENALRESEAKYRNLFESASDAIFLADSNTGIIIDANNKAAKLIGRPVKEIIGMHQMRLHPKEDAGLYKGIFKSHANAQKPFSHTAFVTHKSGRNTPVYISGTHIVLEGRDIIMGIFSDITALKQIEDSLEKDKSNLESTIAEERKDLSAALKDLADSKRLADIGTIAAIVAHELRNPLSVIKAASYNILQKVKAPYLANIKSHVNNIEKKINESDQIISSLLSYSKPLSPNYDEIRICEVIDECVNIFREKCKQPQVKLIVDYNSIKDVRIRADRVQIIALLSNIMDNAYQALSDEAGRIELTCRHDKKENIIYMAIKDNGIGLSKKDISRVFDLFFSLKAKGIGLGLALCKQIVAMHNGTINIQSEKSKGTTVEIKLPILIK